MNSIVITPRNKSEEKLLSELFKNMGIGTRVLTVEEKEEMGLARLMARADRKQKVSRETIIKKLAGK